MLYIVLRGIIGMCKYRNSLREIIELNESIVRLIPQIKKYLYIKQVMND